MKKWTRIILPVYLLLFSSCAVKPTNELIYFCSKNPDNLIPILKINEEAKYLTELIFDGLVNKTTLKDGREQYEWALVDEYREESLENHRLITIYLKKGTYWHDGREFTSADIVYTWKAIQQSDSPLKNWLDTFIESVTLVEGDNYKVKIKLKIERSMEAFMELFSTIKILPSRYIYKGQSKELPFNLNDNSNLSEAFKWLPTGTGPYKIASRRLESVSLTANEGYYSGAPMIKNIRMQVVPDIVKGARVLKSDQLALLFDVKPDFFDELKTAPLENQAYMPFSFYTIAYNTRRKPCSDINFRKAANMATDKEELARDFIEAPQTEIDIDQCVNSSIFPGTSSYVLANPGNFTDANPFDPDEAKKYLNRSSISDKTVRFLISSQMEGNKASALARDYVGMMNKAGIKVIIDDVNIPVYYKKIKEKDFDAVFFQFSGFDHMYDIRELFGNNDVYNIWGVYDNTLQEILEEFGATLSWEELKMWAAAIHTRVEEITPACFLFSVPRRAYYSNRLKNVSIHPEVGFSTVEKWTLE